MTAPSPPRRSSTSAGRRYASPAARSTAAGAAAGRGARPVSPDRTLRGYARVHAGNLTLTTRAALLALALCAVVLTLAYPLREYLAQHRQINQLAAQVSKDRASVAALRLAGHRDADPAYIEEQARTRLHMRRPGDLVFQLRPPPPVKVGKQQAGAVRTPVLPGRSAQAWYSQLYRSTVESGK